MRKSLGKTLDLARSTRRCVSRIRRGPSIGARPVAWVAGGGILLAIAGLALGQATPDISISRRAETLAVNRCASCHEPGGGGSNPRIPQIGGQQRDYIEVQLRAFRNRNRADPDAHDSMWPVSATLNDELISALAEYFAQQPPAMGRFGRGDPAQIAAGKRLYRSGDRARGIAACSACHGIDAEGQSVVPRLAGQHATYLTIQMQAIQGRLRLSTVMHGVIRDFSIGDMEVLALYLESL